MRNKLCGLVAAFVAAGCASSKPVPDRTPVVAETQRVDERDQDLAGVQAVVNVLVRNAGAVPVTASRADWELVTGGAVTGQGTVDLGHEIPAGGEVTLEIPVPFRYARSEAELAGLLGRKEPIEYAVRGTITVGGDTVEFARASAVKAPRLPTLKLASLEAIHSPTLGLTVNASIEIENPNPFGLKLQGVRWNLAVAGKAIGEGIVARGAAIKPSSTTSYELSVNLDLSQLKALGLKPSGSLPYLLLGELDLSPTVVKLERNGEARVLRDGE